MPYCCRMISRARSFSSALPSIALNEYQTIVECSRQMDLRSRSKKLAAQLALTSYVGLSCAPPQNFTEYNLAEQKVSVITAHGLFCLAQLFSRQMRNLGVVAYASHEHCGPTYSIEQMLGGVKIAQCYLRELSSRGPQFFHTSLQESASQVDQKWLQMHCEEVNQEFSEHHEKVQKFLSSSVSALSSANQAPLIPLDPVKRIAFNQSVSTICHRFSSRPPFELLHSQGDVLMEKDRPTPLETRLWLSMSSGSTTRRETARALESEVLEAVRQGRDAFAGLPDPMDPVEYFKWYNLEFATS